MEALLAFSGNRDIIVADRMGISPVDVREAYAQSLSHAAGSGSKSSALHQSEGTSSRGRKVSSISSRIASALSYDREADEQYREGLEIDLRRSKAEKESIKKRKRIEALKRKSDDIFSRFKKYASEIELEKLGAMNPETFSGSTSTSLVGSDTRPTGTRKFRAALSSELYSIHNVPGDHSVAYVSFYQLFRVKAELAKLKDFLSQGESILKNHQELVDELDEIFDEMNGKNEKIDKSEKVEVKEQ